MSDYDPLPESERAPKPATRWTLHANAAVRERLDFENQKAFEAARRGFIATLDTTTIDHDRHDQAVYDFAATRFLEGTAPDTVNPSLWRQAQLNALHHGLFEVVDGIYQIRGFDIANMTLIRGETGWIVIDPLTSSESSRAGLTLANQHLGERPVVCVIHTHSHADHFAGVLGVVSAQDAASGRVQVIAPRDYVDESLAENVLAGNAMGRRATYMYGNLLQPSATGFVSCGLGPALSLGTTGFIIPNDIVEATGETRIVDGIEIEFQMTMGTEAPAEFVFYFPQFKALCMSEIATHHLHNLYTPRGAQVRDALAWAGQLNEAIELFGDRLEVEFASHHWPTWGREAAIDYLSKQRDLYKYIHDQTLRLANHGYTADEIAEQLTLPDDLDSEFYNRDYYGTLRVNAKAVFNRYLGFFDGHPAHLNPLPASAAAAKYVDYMGGADAVVERTKAAYDDGEYRWVAEVLYHVVMADPDHAAGRALLADAMEQMGYQAESAPWRNFYLCGALELRNGLPKGAKFGASAGMAASIPLDNLFKTLAVRLNPERARDLVLHINLHFTDHEPVLLSIERSVLHAHFGKSLESATVSIRISERDFKLLMTDQTDADSLMAQGALQVQGDGGALLQLGGLFDQFERRFPIVTPRPSSPPG